MKRILAAVAVLALAACGEAEAPKPIPLPVPAPQTAVPVPEAQPVAMVPEAPKADPSKELARRVKQALDADGKIQPGAIDVTAAEGKVTLWGTAATEAERQRAGGIATKVEGVASVDNQIKIVKGS